MPPDALTSDGAALAGDVAKAARAWDIGDAALAGDVAALQSAIEAGADVNSANDSGAHPLMLAAHDASVECVSLLLKSGADVHRATRKGRTALHVATTRRALWVKGHGSFIASEKPTPTDDAAIARIIEQFDDVIDLLESRAIDKAVIERATAQLGSPASVTASPFAPAPAATPDASSATWLAANAEKAVVMDVAPGRGWDYIQGKGAAVLRHLETGHAVGLSDGSNGWVHLKQGATAPELVEFSSDSTQPQDWSAEERRLLGILMTSPGAHPLSTSLCCTTTFGRWKFTIEDSGLVMLQNSSHGESPERTRCLAAHGYERARSAHHLTEIVAKHAALQGKTAGTNAPALAIATPSLFGGAPAPTAGLFGGAPAPAAGLFGGAPAPAAGLFGGAPAPAAGLFGGAPAPAVNPFNAPAAGLFGRAPAPAAGLFGGAPAPAAGLFGGAPAPAVNPFNAPAAGLFGRAPAPAAGLFGGAPAPAAGLFGGAPAPAVNPFNAPSTFGAPAPAPAVGFGGFGGGAAGFGGGVVAPAPAPAVGFGGFGGGAACFGGGAAGFGGGAAGFGGAAAAGTGNPPYKPVQEREQVAGAPGQVQVYQYCSITKMPQYDAKSLEELRFEDYAKGNTGAAVLRVEGAGAYDHVQGEYKVDVAAGLKDGVPCYIKVGDPSVAFGNVQATSTITRRDGKWWIASSLSNQPPSMLYSVASTGDKPPPTGWGRAGCMPLPTGLFAPSADKMALMPSIVPLAAGAVASAPIAFSATGGSISSAAGSFGFGVTAPAAAPAFGGGSCTAASSPFGGAAATSPFGGAAATSPFGGAAFGGAPSFGAAGRPGATTASAPSSSPFGGPPAGGVLFGSPASATAPPFAPSSSPFGGPPAGGVLFGSPASVITSPFMPAPAASSVFGPAPAPPPPTLVGSPEAATASSFGAIAASAPEPSAGECVLLTSLADEL